MNAYLNLVNYCICIYVRNLLNLWSFKISEIGTWIVGELTLTHQLSVSQRWLTNCGWVNVDSPIVFELTLTHQLWVVSQRWLTDCGWVNADSPIVGESTLTHRLWVSQRWLPPVSSQQVLFQSGDYFLRAFIFYAFIVNAHFTANNWRPVFMFSHLCFQTYSTFFSVIHVLG